MLMELPGTSNSWVHLDIPSQVYLVVIKTEWVDSLVKLLSLPWMSSFLSRRYVGVVIFKDGFITSCWWLLSVGDLWMVDLWIWEWNLGMPWSFVRCNAMGPPVNQRHFDVGEYCVVVCLTQQCVKVGLGSQFLEGVRFIFLVLHLVLTRLRLTYTSSLCCMWKIIHDQWKPDWKSGLTFTSYSYWTWMFVDSLMEYIGPIDCVHSVK